MSATIPFFESLSRLLARVWKKANRVAAAEDFATALDLDSIKAEALAAELPQETVTEVAKSAPMPAEDAPVVISFEAPNHRAARLLAQTKALETETVIKPTKTGPEAKPKLSYQIEKAIADYVLALKLSHCSPATIRNYKSDIKQFCEFGAEKELSKIFTKPKLLEFAQAETDRGLQSSTVKRKLVSIAQFAVWARKGKLITDQRLIESLDRAETPDLIQFSAPTPVPSQVKAEIPEVKPVAETTPTAPASTSLQTETPSQSGPNHKISSLNQTKLKFSLPALPEAVVTKWLPYFNLAVLSVFVIGLGLFTLRQFSTANPTLAYPSTLTRPNRVLSFQGRLTNTAESPIVGATNMRFRLYDDPSAGSQLWDSNTCSIDPDQDGIFTANLGAGAGGGSDDDDCGAEIDESVFSENSNVWLQVTIGAETLTPRQPIQTVAYALNSETLQGFPAATTATENTVLVMNNSGEVVLGTTDPVIRSTGDTFTLEGEAVTVRSTGSTDLTLTGDANVILNTAGTGVVIAQDYLAAPGATLSATYAGGRALTLKAGPSATADIMQWLTSGNTVLGRITSSGQIGVGNITPEQDLNVANNLQLGVTDGTRYLYFDNGTGNNAGIRYDSATDKMQFSHDGTSWSDMDSGSGAVTSVSNSDGSLTISPTTGVVVASLNMANANTWTGLQTFNNSITDFAQYLRHAGDTDTFLNFTPDKLVAGIGGKNLLDLDTNAVQDLILLGDGTDVDTQILADSSATGLFVEGSTGNVGIGTNAPGAYRLDIDGDTNLRVGSEYFIDDDSVLNYTTLGSSVTASSLTQVGALSSGSIASGFGTIATANTITGTTLNGTTGINTGAGAGTQRITNTGNLVNIGTTQFNTVTYTWPGADGSGSYILSTNGSGTLSWADPSSITASSNYWGSALGSVYVKNNTQDLLVGGQATASAKFGLINVNTGTPTATISGTTANVATYLTGEGTLSTTNRATLTIGGINTGDIHLAPHNNTGLYINASGNVGLGDISPAALFTVGAGDLFQVNSSGAIAAATGITSSGTITFSGLTANRMVSTTAGGQLTTSITSANLASSITNETGGSGVAVFNASPTFTTDITTPKVIGGTAAGSNLALQSTSGTGTTDNITFLVGNNGGTEAMRIINSGNVGIGATAPAARLQVNGSSDIVQFAVRANGTQTSNLVEWQDSSGTPLSWVTGAGVANLAGLTINSAYTFPTADSTSGYVLSTNGSGTVTWADPVALTAASNYWGSALGAVYVKNNTQDVLFGGQASTSAKFAFMNVNTGTPTASISGTTANVNTFLTGEGNLGTTNMATLTIGGATTGDIKLSPNNTTGLNVNGSGFVGINTTTPGQALEVYNANSAINRGHLKFTQETAPTALTDDDSGVAGNPNGTYTYRVTFITANGETEGGTVSGGVTVASKQISLTNIPTGTTGVVTGRNIYRTTNGGTSYRRLGSSPTINDNTTTIYTDNIADGSLNAATAPTSNTTAGGLFVGGSSRLSIDQLGRVGIGTTQPLEKLVVEDDADTYIKVTATTGNSQIAGMKLQRGARLTDSYTDYDLYNSSGNLYLDSLLSNVTTTRLYIQDSTGFTGIGTTSPNLKLDVSGNSSSMTNLLSLSNDNATTNSGTGFVIKGKDSGNNWTDFGGFSAIITDATNSSEDGRVTIKEMVAGTLTDVITLDSGNVGIGGTPSSAKLDIYNSATRLFYVDTNKYAYAKRWYDIDNPTYYLEPGSSSTSLTIAGDIAMDTGKDITGSGLTFGSAGVTVIGGASANTSGNLSINSGAGTLTTNKVTSNIFDPPYWINGNKYATFLPAMVGLKEELAGTVRLQATSNPKLYQYVFDLDNSPEGSEVWLFSRILDLDPEMQNLSVLVSSDSDAKVFYKKDLANRKIIIFGSAPVEVSYRLTGDRFDSDQFSHHATDTDAHGLRPGNYVMNNAPSGAQGVTEADLVAQLNSEQEFTLDDLGEIEIETTLTATPETSTVSLLDAQNQLIERFTAYTQAVVGKLRAGIVQTEHLSADSIAAPLATITNLNAEKVTTTDLVAQTATISGTTKLGSLLANTATVSGSITADSLFAQTASISSSRMNYLESKVAELDMARATSFIAMNATISGTLYAENIADFDQKVADTFRQPSLIATLFGSNEPVLPPPVSGTPASSAASLQQSLAELDLSETDIVINPAAVFIKNYFEVAGNSYFAGSVGMASDLVIGDGLRLTDSELSYTPTNGDPSIFKIQPSGVGRLELMAGRLTIDDIGGVTINSDLRVAGAFTVDETFTASGSAIFNQGLLSKGNIELIGPDGARAATLSANGAFTTTSTVSAQTITATGVGSFGSLKLGSEVLTSTGSGTITTTQPTGKAKLSAGQTEITLKSELITPQTLIYVTPFGSTSNQVLFVKAQTAENPETGDKEGEFKVAVDQALAQDVEFTWWIVN